MVNSWSNNFYFPCAAALGRIITDSTQRWLYPWEIIRILRYAEARDIDISSTKPRRGFPGLYICLQHT